MVTYVNDLRLSELATGEGSGTWGTTTNTNLELIGEALGYGTEQSFSSDADATTTIGDGVSDPARAMYFKVTSAGNLTATRTLTIAPNTVSRVMFIENATSGSQSIAISQGSGANVTIATGKTAVVYLDGAGSGAAVVDAMALVDPGVTDTLAEVLTAGNTTTTDQKIQFRDSAIYINSSADGQLDLVADTEIQIAATTVDINGNLDVSGTTVSAGKITADAGIDIDNINIDGTTIALSSGDLTIDAAGNIRLDADDNGEIRYLDGGTQYAAIKKDGNNALFQSIVADGDFIIQGIDGSSFVSALTLDMSAAGAATFNSTVTASGLTVGDTSDSQTIIQMLANSTNGANTIHFGDAASGAASYVGYINYAHDSNSMQFAAAGAEAVRIDASGRALINKTSSTSSLNLEVQAPTGFSVGSGFYAAGSQSTIEFKDGNTTANYKVRIGSETDDLIMFAGGSERMRIDSVGTTTIKTDGTTQLVLNRADASIQSGNQIANLLITGDDPSAGQSGAAIAFTAGDAWATNSYPTNIIFYNDNSGTLTTRMTLDASGNILFGSNGQGYISGTVANTYNSGYNQDDDSWATWMNYYGYQGGTTRYRDFIVGDGKNGRIATFDGSTGSLGIGTSSSFGKLHVEDTGWSSGSPYGTVAYILGGDVNDANWGHLLISQSGTATGSGGKLSFGSNGDNPIAGIKAYYAGATYGHLDFYTRPSGGTATQRMRINSDGKVDVGGVANQTTAVLNARFNGAAIEFGHGNNGAGYYGTAGSYGNNGHPYIGFSCDGDESANTFTTRGAAGNIITGDLSGNLIFAQVTTASATGQTPANRMMLDASGNLLLGNSSSDAKLHVGSNLTSLQAFRAFGNTAGDTSLTCGQFAKYDNNTTTSQIFVNFTVNNGGIAQGQINANGASQAAFGAWSDRRLKLNIENLPSQLANITALRPVEFDYIESEGGGHQLGFIAQEVEEIYPDLVGERPDGMKTLSSLGKWEARLVKAIQEQQAIIESLEARIAALES